MDGVDYEEATYEGYGPAGVAIMIEILTDNKNRAISEIRYILNRNGGSLGERGCVSWIFNKCGLVLVDQGSVDEDDLLMVALESGAEDVNTLEEVFEVISSVEEFEQVRSAIETSGAKINVAEVAMLPQTTVSLAEKEARQMIRLMEALEDNDDVQKVYANFDIPDEILDAA
jgi:YebC/PmpR family DNA-binding regulatory protein